MERQAEQVFRELGEMFDFLRTLQRSRIEGESEEAYQKRQQQIIQTAIAYPSMGITHQPETIPYLSNKKPTTQS